MACLRGAALSRHGFPAFRALLAISVLWPCLVSPTALAAGPLLAQPAGPGDQPAAPWRLTSLPQQAIPHTRYSVLSMDGQRVLRIDAQASYGNLVHDLQLPVAEHQLAWRWRVDVPNALADLRRKTGDDSPIKVCALFDLPLQAVPFVERQLLRLARLRTGEHLPAATVCYVWDNQLPAGTVRDNAYTRRVRLLVLHGPEAPLRSWQAEQRDLAADFKRMFGDETQTMPPLLGIVVAGDADNTLGSSLAFLADIELK